MFLGIDLVSVEESAEVNGILDEDGQVVDFRLQILFKLGGCEGVGYFFYFGVDFGHVNKYESRKYNLFKNSHHRSFISISLLMVLFRCNSK